MQEIADATEEPLLQSGRSLSRDCVHCRATVADLVERAGRRSGRRGRRRHKVADWRVLREQSLDD
jgi:hypothetical protein